MNAAPCCYGTAFGSYCTCPSDSEGIQELSDRIDALERDLELKLKKPMSPIKTPEESEK